MSDDAFFDDSLALDDAAWEQIDALSANRPPPPAPAPPRAAPAGVSFRPAQQNAVAGSSRAVSGGSSSGGGLRQSTLYGTVASNAHSAPSTSSSKKDHTGERLFDVNDRPSTQGLVQKAGKVWDRSDFARYGAKGKPGKGKGKAAAWDDEDDEENDEQEDDGGFEQFPAPAQNLGELPRRMKHAVDEEEAKTWIYPINLPLRDYQYNIVRASLFKNTLAALPTGLGKTFIAGCVMLNYARWFPTGKIFFVAPTKPLVNQQATAFPETCGFLNDKITVLNGELGADKRAKLYPLKQVFFMTAQTIMNDLEAGRLDPLDVTLLVLDEAHKATGRHAYTQVVQFLQAKNHLFRILALTATPSGKPEGVQILIDKLHLSHIEIRDEESLDLRQYVHKKTTELLLVSMTDNVLELKDLLSKLMMPLMEQLITAGVFREYERDPARVEPYRCRMAGQELQRKKNFRFFHPLKKLEAYARAMGYLLQHSITMFQKSLKSQTTKKDTAKSMDTNKDLREIDAAIERMKTVGGYVPHAKMDRLKGLLFDHFKPREEGDNRGDLEVETTRVMVFVSFRDCLDEIVTMLNLEKPMLRPVAFVGQSTDSEGRKGLKQAEQIQVIKDFKAGKYNIMVATSIGEEGLDIGSVDKIICYDAQKSSVRMLQRVGRTGRKREGAITVLMGEGKEEDSWNRAKDNYVSVQDAITNGHFLELYDDVPRLLPDEFHPTCVQKVVPIDSTVPDFLVTKATRKTSRAAHKGGKQTKSVKVAAGKHGSTVPTGALDGFVTAGKLTKRKKITDSDLEDDSEDEAIMNGLPPTYSSKASVGRLVSSGMGRDKGRATVVALSSDEEAGFGRAVKRPRTESSLSANSSYKNAIPKPRAPPPPPRNVPPPEPIEISDNDEDGEITVVDESPHNINAPKPSSFRAASGPIRHRPPVQLPVNPRPNPSFLPPPAPDPAHFSPSWSLSPEAPPPIRLSQKEQNSLSPEVIFRKLPVPAPSVRVASLPADVAARAGFEEIDPRWILDGDDDEYDTSFAPSPVAVRGFPPPSYQAPAPSAIPLKTSTLGPSRSSHSAHAPSNHPPALATPSVAQRISNGRPSGPILPLASVSRPQPLVVGKTLNQDGTDLSWVLADDESDSFDSPAAPKRPLKRPPPSDMPSFEHSTKAREMPPPSSTRRPSNPHPTDQNGKSVLDCPFLPTQPIRRPAGRPKMRNAVLSSPAESFPNFPNNRNAQAARDASPPTVRRGQAGPSTKTASAKNPSWYRDAVPNDVRRYFDKTAGDDRDEPARRRGEPQSSGTISDDGSAVDDEPSSSDLAFAGDFQATQVPRGYDQHRVYLNSILSPDAQVEYNPQRRFARVSSDGPDVDGGAEDDAWEMGTFVVEDDDPLVYDRSSEADEWMRR